MRISQHLRTIVGAALLLAAASASAQYVWTDDKGKRTYSDRPPPPGVPAERILKAPKGMEQIMAANAQPAAAAAPEAGPSPLAQREADFQKRRKESAEQAQKAQAEAAQAADRKRSCDTARRAKTQLESGMRLRSQNSADAHAVMGDAERASELARANQVIAACR